jgi:hypothetical protein
MPYIACIIELNQIQPKCTPVQIQSHPPQDWGETRLTVSYEKQQSKDYWTFVMFGGPNSHSIPLGAK